ncbi:metaphase chromosome protein 1 [Leuconostoc gasicomitatum]|uniref:metaphase chromosome protein 1 n=1 Tax=Leuconostoc gasicomitatum TaxID=115778 RepID=UPI001CC72AD2|nr:metaphase chromosome protein 1 [Leuconostoc gasicomitatum]MBR2277086.1 metaphase chromosome protein 1 [Leuconostoc sp.]MBZ5954119.1 metaphase chromosome protein 1 [Leuconostoc gasicomitatum]MBZ5955909.1 metaphase chromosome protein 1 [Leuconostoc gasicomitatum]
MKQGKTAQIKKMKQVQRKQKLISKNKLPEFNYNEFAGFLRARYYLTHNDKYNQETFEVASFFLDDVIAMMVNQNFTKFTSNERAVVKLNEVMQASLVNSDDKDWRYFVLLVPVLYDMQQFIVKEGSVNARYVAQAPKFDINFWRMIMRTVMAINFFKWQGKDVAEMMKTSQVIDDLQFKFLSENEKDDDFNLAIIAETFKALAVKIKPLKTENKILELNELSPSEIADELSYANKSLKQFKEASVKGVVSENVMNMLYAFHEGMAKEYNVTHTLWDADTLNSFAMSHLMSYWTPVWDSLDGIGGEVKSYLNFLSQKKAIQGLGKMVTDTSDIDRYIDVTALNKLLAQMSSERLENLA